MAKLTFFFIVAGLMHAHAHTYAQKLSITAHNQPLTAVFEHIEKQTGYVFFYDKTLVRSVTPVTLKAVNENLQEVLEQVLIPRNLYYIIENKTIIVFYQAAKQPAILLAVQEPLPPPPPVRIIVTDTSGRPLAGASVIVRNSKTAGIADANGGVNMELLPGVVLDISFVGYEKVRITVTEAAISKQLLTVVLKAAVGDLEDVAVMVNTGYQELPKERAAGSFVVIDKKMLNEQTGTNILERLDGLTNGLQIIRGKEADAKSNTNITVRGFSTINGPRDPLIILDNFKYDGDINNINPNDVESITILKDASAASIWGAQAANGVIIINTIKGKFNQKQRVTVSGSYLFSAKPDLFYETGMRSQDYLKIEEYLFSRGYFDADINSIYKKSLLPSVYILNDRKKGLISAADSLERMNALSSYDLRSQYEKYLYRTGLTQQYAVNFSGGTSNTAWAIRGNYNNVQSQLRDIGKKINVGADQNFKITEGFKISLRLYYTHSSSLTPKMEPYTMLSSMNTRYVQYLAIADNNGNPLPLYRYNQRYIDTVGKGRLLDWRYYPLTDYKYDQSFTSNQEIVGNVNVNYQLLKGLNLTGEYQHQRRNYSSGRKTSVESYYTRDIINNFTQFNSDGGVVNNIPVGDIWRTASSISYSSYFRGMLNFDKTFNRHNIVGIAGTEFSDNQEFGRSNNIIYGVNDNPYSATDINNVNYYPTLVSGSLERIPGSSATQMGVQYVKRATSVYGNIAYNYAGKYTFTASFRKDAANIFGQKTNDRWNPFWSSGFKWNLSDESFYQFTAIPKLTIRSSYGYTGNVNAGLTPLPVGAYATNSITRYPIFQISTLNNPLLRWEKTKMINLGLEFSSINDIVSGSIEYYYKKSLDLYGEKPIDYTGGFEKVTMNTATHGGNGIDIAINTKNISGVLKWNTTFIFNYNKSKVLEYYTTSAEKIQSTNVGNIVFPIVGYPLYSVTAYRWGGLNAKGDPIGYIGNDTSTNYRAITSNNINGLEGGTLKYLGSGTPEIFGGIHNSFSVKGFTLSVNLQYKGKYYFVKNTFTSSRIYNNGKGHADYYKRWQKAGDELNTHVPAFVYADYPDLSYRDGLYTGSEVNVLKGDHIRLQYINMRYNLPSKKSFRASLFTNFANLGIIWRANKYQIDPDTPTAPPQPLQVTIGFSAQF